MHPVLTYQHQLQHLPLGRSLTPDERKVVETLARSLYQQIEQDLQQKMAEAFGRPSTQLTALKVQWNPDSQQPFLEVVDLRAT